MTISRAQGSLSFPDNFMLMAARNPCRFASAWRHFTGPAAVSRAGVGRVAQDAAYATHIPAPRALRAWESGHRRSCLATAYSDNRWSGWVYQAKICSTTAAWAMSTRMRRGSRGCSASSTYPYGANLSPRQQATAAQLGLFLVLKRKLTLPAQQRRRIHAQAAALFAQLVLPSPLGT